MMVSIMKGGTDMIPDDKERIIVTIPKDDKDKLNSFCKSNNLTKSAAVSIALSVLFASGYKIGDIIGQMVFDERKLKDE